MLGVTKPLTVNVAVRRESGSGSRRPGFLAKQHQLARFGMTSGFPLVSRDVELMISSEAAEL